MKRWITALALLALACGGDGAGPEGPLRFSDREIQLGDGLSGQVIVENAGPTDLNDVRFRAEGVPDGVTVALIPGSVGVFRAGRRLSFSLGISFPVPRPGDYSFDVIVLSEGVPQDRVTIRFEVD